MFDLIFSALSAWNALGLFLMAFVFLAIGGGIVGYSLFWRLKAKRIRGRICGLMMGDAPTEAEDSVQTNVSAEGSTVGGFIVIFFFVLFPLIFSGIGAWQAYGYFSLTTSGRYADAVVVRNESSHDSDSGTSYKAVLAFTDHSGQEREVTDMISYGSSPSFDTGTRIGVYYDPVNPARFVIDDFWHNMAIAIIFIAFGFMFILFFGLIFYFGNREKAAPERTKKKKGSGGEFYYPIYEYKSLQGERMEHIEDVGGTTFLHCLPGKEVTLLMLPGDPPKVKKASVLGLIFGLFFLLPGLFIANVAVSQFEISFLSVLFVLGIIGYGVFRVYQKYLLIPEEERRKGWAMIRSGEAFKPENISYTSSSKIFSGSKGRRMTPEEIRARIGSQKRMTVIGAFVMILIAGGLGVGAYYAQKSMVEYSTRGIKAEGKVTGFESKDSDDSIVYHAIVEFTDQSGNSVKFQDSVGSSHPSFKRGDAVSVLYLPETPSAAMVDRGIFNWVLSGGLILGAALFLWGALASLRLAASVRSGAERTAL